MALYLGNDKVKLNLDGIAYKINWHSTILTIEEIILSSFDDCLLKDVNGLYLSMKESE